jgi:hypothetical protein
MMIDEARGVIAAAAGKSAAMMPMPMLIADSGPAVGAGRAPPEPTRLSMSLSSAAVRPALQSAPTATLTPRSGPELN